MAKLPWVSLALKPGYGCPSPTLPRKRGEGEVRHAV
jgi:hypothetical protein